MKVSETNKRWMAALAAVSLAAGAAIGTAEMRTDADPEAVQTVQEISVVFREAAQKAAPAVVSIETKGKPMRLAGRRGGGGGEGGQSPEDMFRNSPFRQFFENDEQFKRFFEERMPEGGSRGPTPQGMGSGFIIDPDGVIMTNNHVVADAEVVTVKLQDGREFTATDVRTDPRTDVAIVRVETDEPLPSLKLGESSGLEIGDWVLAIGNPFGFSGSVTAGIISGKGRGMGITDREDFLQTDAAINPGNSGGPLINLNGEVVGINTAISTRSGGYDGIGFAIPVDMARWVSEQLVEGGSVKRAYLGIGIQPVEGKLAEELGVASGGGVIVNDVRKDTPAAKGGVESGDIIVELNGQKISSPRELQGLVERLEVGKDFTLTVLRNGERQDLKVTAEEMPELFGHSQPATESDEPQEDEGDSSITSYDEIGIKITELSPAVAEQLGFDEDAQGVLITEVAPGTPAHDANLAAGQLIQRVGKIAVKSPEDFERAMKEVSLKDGIVVHLRTADGASPFVVIKSN